jgi:branched-chain amino acid transport system substrate-binding protein
VSGPHNDAIAVAGLRPAQWRRFGLAGLIALALVIPFGVSSFQIFQLTLALHYAIALLGLNILTGYNGQISLGHGAFYAVGAYVSAILMDQWNVPYYWTVPVAGAVSFVAGFLFGLPALRLHGLYLAVATLGLAVAVPQLLKYEAFEHWTGGVQGIFLNKPEVPFGLPITQDQWLYFFVLAFVVVFFWAGANLVRGRSGRAMVAIRDHHISAEIMGINTALYKTLTFGVSALYTGVAGALGAIVVQFVAPDSFQLFLSITLLVGSVVGGLTSIAGALYGGLFVLFIPNLAQQISDAAPWAIYGVILLLFMYAMPQGIAGFIRALGAKIVRAANASRPTNEAATSQPNVDRSTEEVMRISMRVLIPLVAMLAGVSFVSAAQAQNKMYGPGVTDKEIEIGNTNPYSGPASAYGAIGKAISAYFDKVNAEGGINGRKIKFISLDDGYSPPKTVEQIRKLVEQDKVLLVFQSLGTPPNSAIHKYMNAKKVPQLFVATGATKWADPQHFPWTMGWQPNYQTEAKIYAKYILDNVKDPKVAVLYQNDDYGKDYLTGLRDGFGSKADSLIVKTASYEVSDPTVDSQIVNLKNSGANVFVNIATPKFAAQAIRKAYDIGWKPVQLLNNVSTSIPRVLKAAGLEKAVGIISSAYQKEPGDPQWKDDKGYADWLAWMKKYNPKGNLGSNFNVYGYNVAMTMEHVLRMAGDDLTRDNIMKMAANIKNLELPMLLPGIKINTGPADFSPIEQMQLMKFDGKGWERFGSVISAESGS